MASAPMSGAALTSTKERHYAFLAARLDALATTVQHTQHYMAIASEQAAYLKDLGIGQASLYVRRHDTHTASWPSRSKSI